MPRYYEEAFPIEQFKANIEKYKQPLSADIRVKGGNKVDVLGVTFTYSNYQILKVGFAWDNEALNSYVHMLREMHPKCKEPNYTFYTMNVFTGDVEPYAPVVDYYRYRLHSAAFSDRKEDNRRHKRVI